MEHTRINTFEFGSLKLQSEQHRITLIGQHRVPAEPSSTHQANSEYTIKRGHSLNNPWQSSQPKRNCPWRSTSGEEKANTVHHSQSPHKLGDCQEIINETQISVGSIVFLGNHNLNKSFMCQNPNCSSHFITQNDTKKSTGLGHPAVVVKMVDGQPLLCLMSSCSRPVPHEETSTFPVSTVPESASSSSHYRQNPWVFPERDGSLFKVSWIHIKHIYRVPISRIRNLGPAFANRICQKSYSSLMDKIGMTPQTWVSTVNLEARALNYQGLKWIEPGFTQEKWINSATNLPVLPAEILKPSDAQQKLNAYAIFTEFAKNQPGWNFNNDIASLEKAFNNTTLHAPITNKPVYHSDYAHKQVGMD